MSGAASALNTAGTISWPSMGNVRRVAAAAERPHPLVLTAVSDACQSPRVLNDCQLQWP